MSERESGYGNYVGRWPAEVTEYNPAKRQCRVSIPPLTDGANEMPWAEIEYPIGDKSSHSRYPTEIEMLPGDLVWVTFIGNDVRYPIITGYRNKQTGNSHDWRRWHHKNIALEADEQMTLEAKTIRSTADEENLLEAGREVIIEAPVIRLKGAVIFEGGYAGAGAGKSLLIESEVSVTIKAPTVTVDTPNHVTTGEHTDINGKHG